MEAGREARRWKLVAGAAGAALVLALIALAFVLGSRSGEDGASATDVEQQVSEASEARDTAAAETDTEADTDEDTTDEDVTDDTTPSRLRPPPGEDQPRLVGSVPLNPVEALKGDRDAKGQAGFSSTGRDVLQLVVQAELPDNAKGDAYEVWLYNSDKDAMSLGAQVTNDQGLFQGTNNLPEGFEKYRFIDISREPIAGPKTHSGKSVLRGDLSDFEAPGGSKPPR